MTVSTAIKAAFAAAAFALVWLFWPIYGFYAHMGAVPLPPFGWLKMEGDAPVAQEALDPAYAQAGDTVIAALDRRRRKIGAPAFSAAVAVDGEIVWRGAVGWADLKRKTPATPATQFRIGSTSKAVTATALARLVDRGVMDLDAPISAYLDPLPNDAWTNITARQLASHMAGLPHYGDNTDIVGLYKTGALRQHYADVRDALEIFDGSSLLSEPGAAFSYSSLGTVLLGAVMSEAAGKPYREIVQDEVLAPAGMTATIVAPKRADAESDLATFYLVQDGRQREWRPVDLSHRLPGGGYASTPSDLVRMGAQMLDDDYISPATRDAFWTPQKLANGEVNEQAYAIGWRWREYEVEGVGLARNANHGGVSRGSQSWLLVFPDYDMTIAFNINTKTDEFRDFGMAWEDLFREFALAKQAKEMGAAFGPARMPSDQPLFF